MSTDMNTTRTCIVVVSYGKEKPFFRRIISFVGRGRGRKVYGRREKKEQEAGEECKPLIFAIY